jgi:eukaryotic-like serine/threonine-protein kinase
VPDRSDKDRPNDSSAERGGVTAPDPPLVARDFASTGVRIGDVFAGKYRVERILGMGGMGVVVAAHHIQLDEKVALKFLPPHATHNADAAGRFAREARAAAKIKSEHVARVTDVGQLEDGAPYIVMEYLEGIDLSTWLTEHGRMPAEQAVGFVLQACEAIAEAHVLGIVHRDLKPANLFLARRPSGPDIVKVLDFGISKSLLPTSQPQITKTNAIMGSPLYMSPEQMQSSKTLDVRSDIWSLGVVLYELLSGKVPFTGDTMPELVVAVLQVRQEPLRSLCPDLPAGLGAVVDRCLAKDLTDRFANVGELAAELGPFGPPRSDVSVERISQLIATAHRSSIPVAVVTPLHQLGVSPVARTLEGVAPTLREGTPHGRSGHEGALLGASTTSAKPVSSDPVLPDVDETGRRMWVLPAAALLLIAGVGMFLSQRDGSPSTSPANPSSQPSVAASAAPSAISTVPASASQAASSGPPPAASASVPATRPSAAPSETARSASTRKPASTAPSPAKPSCDPPYVLDDLGHHRYKPECIVRTSP